MNNLRLELLIKILVKSPDFSKPLKIKNIICMMNKKFLRTVCICLIFSRLYL